ncbi:alpha/beta hydrolase-fold protein [Termitidicoccus mucosus]|uniref:Esterase n=1 Tax=Termitidicoccus mucosus TaxID=1184151 RepID=A0A178ICR2_9BACT|nr:esterase [Opitutaceae bacterium TSB47]
MKSLPLLIAAALFCALPLSAASSAEWRDCPAFVQGRQRDIHSSATGRDYRIFISVPDTPPPAEGFPVLYVLDGNGTFPFAALISRSWRERGAALGIHPGIVVGIGYPVSGDLDLVARAEDYTPPAPDLSDTGDFSGSKQGGADRFLDFIENELKPLLAAGFRLDPSRQTLFGHSYGGLFTLHALFTRPGAFQRYVASSPSIWWNHRRILAERDAFLKARSSSIQQKNTSPRLVITVGSLEQTPRPSRQPAHRAERVIARRQVDNARELSASLADVGLENTLYVFEDDNHGSAQIPAINHAIRVAFAK